MARDLVETGPGYAIRPQTRFLEVDRSTQLHTVADKFLGLAAYLLEKYLGSQSPLGERAGDDYWHIVMEGTSIRTAIETKYMTGKSAKTHDRERFTIAELKREVDDPNPFNRVKIEERAGIKTRFRKDDEIVGTTQKLSFYDDAKGTRLAVVLNYDRSNGEGSFDFPRGLSSQSTEDTSIPIIRGPHDLAIGDLDPSLPDHFDNMGRSLDEIERCLGIFSIHGPSRAIAG